MPGFLVVMGAISDPSLKPTIDCCAIDHGLLSISRKVCPECRITGHGMRDPLRLRVHSRGIDDEHRRVQLPVRPKHLPTSGNHALPAIFNLARPFGIGADQMRATNKARRKTTARETVESRTTSPDKNAIRRAGPLDDRLDNRTMIERRLTQSERHDKENEDRDVGSADDTYSQGSPVRLRRGSLLRDEAREGLSGENRQRWKHRQMIMPRKPPPNKDCQIGHAEPQNKQRCRSRAGRRVS